MKKARKRNPRNCYPRGSVWHFHMRHQGQLYRRSLDVDIEDSDLAELKAASWRQHVRNGTWEDRIAEDKPHDTVADLFDAFWEYVPASELRGRTPQGYVAAAMRILRTVHPGQPVKRLTLDVFRPDLIRRYRELRLAQSYGSGPKARNTALVSAAREIGNMRGLFSRKALQSTAYQRLRLDRQALQEMKQWVFPQGRAMPFTMPPQSVIDRMESDLKRMQSEEPHRWLAAMLCSNVGLRRTEGVWARLSDFVENEINGERAVQFRAVLDDERDYKGSLGSVPVEPRIYDRICELVAWDGYILPGTKSDRDDLYRENSAWLRSIGWDSRRPNHELRKYFGAMLATRHDIWTAQRALRHSTIKTTNDLYADIINNNRTIPPIGLD